MTQESPTEPLARTPLYGLHVGLGAKTVPFAGYEMPLQYRTGLLKEHLHTRREAGLFDVSHMGQLSLTCPDGDPADIAAALEALIPIDLLDLPVGRQRYGFLLNESGGMLDDLMIANLGRRFAIVVNAANKQDDFAYLRARLPRGIEVELRTEALIALQGPQAEGVLARFAPAVRDMAFMDVRELDVLETRCVISRSGYTGEDGFELSIPPSSATTIADALLSDQRVLPIGLGARDSLRLEAGLCLHGADIGPETTPVEASLAWAIPPVRRRAGKREGGFPAASRLLAEMEGGTSRCRVGLRAAGRLPVRAGAPLFDREAAADPIGTVTSGCFGPSLEAPVAMGYLPTPVPEIGSRIFAEIRGQRLPLEICRLPFVPARFKRGAAAGIHGSEPC